MSVISKAGSGLAIFAASALVLSGCAAATTAEPAEEAAEETTEESAPVGDLALKIGTALPPDRFACLPRTARRSGCGPRYG